MSKPKIRFNGFTEDWEQRKVKDIAPLQRGFDLPTSQMEEGVYPVVMSNGVGGYHSQYKVKGPGVVTGRSGTIGRLHYIEEDYWPHNTTLWVTDFYGNDQKFIYYMYQCLDLSHFSTGSGVPTLNRNDVHDEVVCIPSVGEQMKISDYLTSLDRLITLHQRKCEQTKKLKKFMLQKMFPQNGKTVPEIRFEGFTEDWEQRKLGEIVERVTRKNQDLVSTLPLTISAQYGLIDQNEFFDKRVASKDVSGYYLVKKGEFAYNKSTSSDAPWGAIKRLDRYENGVLSTLYIVFAINENVEIDSDYLVTYYDTDLWHRGIREIAAEGARNHGLLNIAPADFFETSLSVPQDIEEQKAIGKFFAELNALITLYQRKCEELQKTKKFMLQNMFV